MGASVSTERTSFLKGRASKVLLVANITVSLLYFAVIVFAFTRGNNVLFWLLVGGEIFHLWQALTFFHTIWPRKIERVFDAGFTPFVDVYITVAGEPIEVVEKTVRAAAAMDYPNFKVYVLNDGLVAQKDNWREIEGLARRLGVECITRRIAGGAKAGNINHALKQTSGPFIAVFDADHAPRANFLQKMLGYFVDESVAFVQSPQYYKNYSQNYLTGAAWEQQELFFGPVCIGKDKINSAFMCGTNMVIRRAALMHAGGMVEDNIAEDFLTSLFVHERGWRSVYVPEVLAEGLAPEDLLSYYRQQFRWARGSLELIFKFNPLFRRGLSWAQKIQYLASASYYLSGPVVLVNALLPVIFFFTGLVPLEIVTMAHAAVFLPYIFLILYTLQVSSNFTFTFRALSLSLASYTTHLHALWALLWGQKSAFAVTSKKRLSGNFWHLSLPHIAYVGIVIWGVAVAIHREGLSASVVTNFSWSLFSVVVFMIFIILSLGDVKISIRKPRVFRVRLNYNLARKRRIEEQ